MFKVGDLVVDHSDYVGIVVSVRYCDYWGENAYTILWQNFILDAYYRERNLTKLNV